MSENKIEFNNKVHFNSYICIYSFNIKVHNYSKAFQTVFHISITKKLTKIDIGIEVLSTISKISFTHNSPLP